jgi:hypothetical protein
LPTQSLINLQTYTPPGGGGGLFQLTATSTLGGADMRMTALAMFFQ